MDLPTHQSHYKSLQLTIPIHCSITKYHPFASPLPLILAMADLFCPTFLSTGECLNPYCSLNHTNCILCQKMGLTREGLWDHIKGKKHRKRMKKYQRNVQWTCPTCNRTMETLSRRAHERGKRHRRMLAALSAQQTSNAAVATPAPLTNVAAPPVPPLPVLPPPIPPPPVPTPPVAVPDHFQLPSAVPSRPALVECTLCKCSIPLPRWNEHLHDPVHARRARVVVYHRALEEGSRDKFGVNIVQPELDFGIIDISSLAEWPTRENVFYIRLQEGAVFLRNIQLTSQLGSQSLFRDAK